MLGTALAVSLLATVIIKATGERDSQHKLDRLLVVTYEGDKLNREAFERFNRSLQVNKLDLVVLRPSSRLSNDGRARAENKIDLLKNLVGAYKDEQNLLILLVNGENTIINGDINDIVRRLSEKFNPRTRVIFSADSICWPNASLDSSYLKPVSGGEPYLNSKAFLGYASALWDLLSVSLNGKKKILVNQTKASFPVDDVDDDDDNEIQLHFTKLYLDANVRREIGIELDHRAELFQNLPSFQSNVVELEITNETAKLKNLPYLTEPIVVQGNEASRVSRTK